MIFHSLSDDAIQTPSLQMLLSHRRHCHALLDGSISLSFPQFAYFSTFAWTPACELAHSAHSASSLFFLLLQHLQSSSVSGWRYFPSNPGMLPQLLQLQNKPNQGRMILDRSCEVERYDGTSVRTPSRDCEHRRYVRNGKLMMTHDSWLMIPDCIIHGVNGSVWNWNIPQKALRFEGCLVVYRYQYCDQYPGKESRALSGRWNIWCRYSEQMQELDNNLICVRLGRKNPLLQESMGRASHDYRRRRRDDNELFKYMLLSYR